MIRYLSFVILFLFSVSSSAQSEWTGLDATKFVFNAKHGPQGTGNYKGKRDRHEKPTPMHEKKRKSKSWIQR